MGEQAAADLLLTARRVTGTEALDLGLVDQVANQADLRAAATARARAIAANAPLATRDIRALLRRGLADEVRASMTRERAAQDRLMMTFDHTAGVAASQARRDPRFDGR